MVHTSSGNPEEIMMREVHKEKCIFTTHIEVMAVIKAMPS